MNSRRKFLLQGGMATTALLAAKPFKTMAEAGFAIPGFSVNDNKITVAHTVYPDHAAHGQLVREIAEVKNSSSNVLLLHTGNAATDNLAKQPAYDASISRNNAVSASANDYRIVYKGNIKIGVISAIASDDAIGQVNSLSAFLKKEKKCHIVVCLSQLGSANKNAINDRKLAAASSSLDMIIGGNAKDHFKYPLIVLNKDNAEVIISHVPEMVGVLNQVDMAFDKSGKKKNVFFTKNIEKMTA